MQLHGLVPPPPPCPGWQHGVTNTRGFFCSLCSTGDPCQCAQRHPRWRERPGGRGARWGTRPCVPGHPSHGQPRPSLPCAHVPGTCLVAVCVAAQMVTFLAEDGSCRGDGEGKENVERFQPTSTSRRGSSVRGRRANGKETCSALRAALCLGKDRGFCLLFSFVVCLQVLT